MLPVVGAFSGLDRVYVLRWDDSQEAGFLVDEWCAAGVPGVGTTIGDGLFRYADFEAVFCRLLAGDTCSSPITERTGANAALFDAASTPGRLFVPIMLAGRFWGAMAFDDCQHLHVFSASETRALQGAAVAVAAAVLRDEAQAALPAEHEHSAAARSADLERSNAALSALNLALQLRDRLLTAVAQALKVLLGPGNLTSTVEQALRLVGEAAHMHRVKVILQQGGTAGQPAQHALAYEWWAPGLASQRSLGLTHFPDAAVAGYVARLQGGHSLWQLIDEVPDDGLRAAFQLAGMQSMGVVPIFAKDRYAGMVAFDDCLARRQWSNAEIDSLTIAAQAIGAAIEREDVEAVRLQAESQRRKDAERHAAKLQCHAELLAAVAQSAEDLLAAREFWPQIDAVLARIGQVSHADRACLLRLDWTPDDAEVLCFQHLLHEWTRPGARHQMDTDLRRFPVLRSDSSHFLMTEQLASQGRILARIDTLNAPFSSEQQPLGIAWALVYPVMVSGTLWGLLGFDYATPSEDVDEADLAALRTVASTIADALVREQLETARLAVERERADDALALNHLLEGVVAASRSLLEVTNFEQGLRQWLAFLAEAVDADRAIFGEFTSPDQSDAVATQVVDWAKPGVPSVTGMAVPVTSDFIAWTERLQRGEIVWAHREDLVDEASLEFWRDQACWTNLLVPVIADSQVLGWLSFDFIARREWQPAYGTALRTAADGAAAAIKRNQALRALMAEREARLLAEQRRSSELTRVNESLRLSLDALAGQDGEAAFLRDVMVQLQCQMGAQVAYLFRSDDADGRLRLLGRCALGRFSQQAAADDPPMFTRGFEMVPQLLDTLLTDRRLLWRRVDHTQPIDAATSESTRWHLHMGHRANAVHALMIGTRQVGFVGMVFDHDEPLTQAQLELAHALCQPITLALELARLSRLAQRSSEQSTMLKERNRMARDVHDTLAQGFTAISLQLQAAARADDPEERSRFVARATEEALSNLVESRRTIRLLRGVVEPDSVTHKLAHVLEDALSSRLTGSSMRWRVQDLAEDQGEPPLTDEARRELKRIAQEAATNALKHSRASFFEAQLSVDAAQLSLRLVDDGQGFDPGARQDGFGLVGMRERAHRIGARFEIESSPGLPTAVVVTLALTPWSQQGVA